MENIQETENAVNAVIAQSTFSNTCGNNRSITSICNARIMASAHSRSNSYTNSQSRRSYKTCILNRQEYTENNVKISDSGYSNSCSNSQSRRSYSSKSMHSGSLSSGSSGYGGKPSTSSYSHAIQLSEKRMKDREVKKKKKMQIVSKMKKDKYVVVQSLPQLEPVQEITTEYGNNAILSPPPLLELEEKTIIMDISTSLKCNVKTECGPSNSTLVTTLNCVTRTERRLEGFSCVISMHDGTVMYTTTSITAALGFPKDMWVGRSFIDFVHPRDRNTFASQITNGLTVPKNANVATQSGTGNQTSTMVCRIRRYRGLQTGFRIKEKILTYMPFLLKFFFKNVVHDESHVVYLVIQATPYYSAFKTPNEVIVNAKPFVIRHSASGSLEFIDTESVPYLGYLPQDILKKNALQLYHPADLGYVRQIYESIVKEGVVERSKPYRVLTQNGDYLKLVTEWSSFINPWSRKLEFVTAKHFIIEGPRNPDVFQAFESERAEKFSEEIHQKAHILRQNIIRVMNEVLTKPAEAAKQQMGKRCQDLASFMESLLEDTPTETNDTDMKVEIHDTDMNSFYDRDSMIVGGMSPHHDFSDIKSSTEAHVSYNQLNYNENLQRYFDCYEPYEDVSEKNLSIKDAGENNSICMSLIEEVPEGYDEGNLYGASSLIMSQYMHPLGDYKTFRLTESVLSKHNADMEKELVKRHRDNRICSKFERDILSSEMKQKKKEHLARCNAFIQQSILENAEQKPQGVKRTSRQKEEGSAQKHRCSSARLKRQKQIVRAANSQSNSTMGVIPMLYTPAPFHHPSMAPPEYLFNRTSSHMQGHSSRMGPHAMMGSHYQGHRNEPEVLYKLNPTCSTSHRPSPYLSAPYQAQQMPYLMFGQAVYASPFMYSSIDPQISYTLQQSFVPQNVPSMYSLEISNKNYEEACKMTVLPKTNKSFSYLTRKREKVIEKQLHQSSDVSNSSSDTSYRNKRSLMENRNKRKLRLTNSEDSKTDEESSYSSFYSSFFKTDSGSNGESDGKISNDRKSWQKQNGSGDAISFQSFKVLNGETKKKSLRSNIEPPWTKQVRVTSELIYKYQICTKDMDEVLRCDKEKLEKLEQPALVNEQLGQLYLDLQLQGVAAKLTLEEGITSSSSSGEESYVTTKTKIRRRKREFSKLVMIYEEDAPLPPPDEEDA
ncbi:period circadian protein isoform X2 [Nymphalis io]|uniref:period circadian protein isoform X2 n=1 Tax=Inachis io TaxID=171585 RepID=UPI002168D20B|nr:period circadian protein isoform X2 [Nymphalis io]